MTTALLWCALVCLLARYKSHRTGEVAHEAFTRVAVPPWWRSDFLRALRHFAASDVWDPRLRDAYRLLLSKCVASNPRDSGAKKGSKGNKAERRATAAGAASGADAPRAARVGVADIRALRHALLRPEQPASASVYPKDDDTETGHYGVYVRGALVGVASVFHDAMPGSDDQHAWRIRGMATSPGVRGTGCGRLLALACLDHATRGGGEYVWCNARPAVKGFYERFGFSQLGELFNLHGHGTRLKMRCTLPFQPSSSDAAGGVAASASAGAPVPVGWWELERLQAGKQHFKLEPVGRASRLVTAQALGVVQWWRAKTGSAACAGPGPAAT